MFARCQPANCGARRAHAVPPKASPRCVFAQPGVRRGAWRLPVWQCLVLMVVRERFAARCGKGSTACGQDSHFQSRNLPQIPTGPWDVYPRSRGCRRHTAALFASLCNLSKIDTLAPPTTGAAARAWRCVTSVHPWLANHPEEISHQWRTKIHTVHVFGSSLHWPSPGRSQGLGDVHMTKGGSH